ncbi:MAG: hypothetical protein PHQ74_12615 [Crocinitomicaceae bacterium]|nr:hypothetical protein [Crocinitomicaceae bacterium]
MKKISTSKIILSFLFLLLILAFGYFLFVGRKVSVQKVKTAAARYDTTYNKYFAQGAEKYIDGKFKAAIKSWEIVFDYAKKDSIKAVEISISTNIGAAYNSLGYYKTALSYFLNSNSVYEKMKLKNKGYWMNYLNIGACYVSLKQLDTAEKYLKSTLSFDEEIDFLKNFNLANLYGEKNDKKLFHSYKKKVDQQIGDFQLYSSGWNSVELDFLIKWKDTASLKVFLTEMQPTYQEELLGTKLLYNRAHLMIYQKLFEPIEKIESYEEEIEAENNFSVKKDFYNLLKSYYVKQNNISKVLYYSDLIFESSKSFADEQNILAVEDYITAQALIDLKSKYEAEKLLGEVVKQQLAQSKLQFRFSVLLILIAIAIAILLFKNAKKSKLIDQLKLSESQSQLLIKELEKKELSDNLRLSEDELNSSMVSIKKILLLKKQLYDLSSTNASKDDELIKQINLILNSFFDNYRDLNYLINKKVNVEKVISTLKSEFPNLNEREFQVVEYVLLQFTTKEIALLMDKSEKSIEYNRTQIRKKINLSADNSLENYLSAIG